MKMQKEAVSRSDLLKWILGSAAVGAGAKGVFHLGRELLGPADSGVFGSENVYDPEVPLDIEMSPEEYEEYQRLREERLGKHASAWDPTIYTATGALAGVGGWLAAKKLLSKLRSRKLDSRLDALREEFAQLSSPVSPEVSDEAEEDEQKVAAAWSWLDEAAQEAIEKVAFSGLGGRLASFAKKHVIPLSTAGSAVAAPLALSAVPGLTDAAGSAVVGTGAGIASGVSTPVIRTLIRFLGPIAALGLLYGGAKGWSATRDSSKSRSKIKALTSKMRGLEADQTPHFSPRPVVKGERREAERKGPSEVGLNKTYTEAEQGDEEEDKVASDLSSAMVDAFNLGFFKKLASLGYSSEEQSELSQLVGNHLRVAGSGKTAAEGEGPLIDFYFDKVGFVKEALRNPAALKAMGRGLSGAWGGVKRLFGGGAPRVHQRGPVLRKVTPPRAGRTVGPQRAKRDVLSLDQARARAARDPKTRGLRGNDNKNLENWANQRTNAWEAEEKRRRYVDRMNTNNPAGLGRSPAPAPQVAAPSPTPPQMSAAPVAPDPQLPQGPGMLSSMRENIGNWAKEHPTAAQGMMTAGIGLGTGYLGSRMGSSNQPQQQHRPWDTAAAKPYPNWHPYLRGHY